MASQCSGSSATRPGRCLPVHLVRAGRLNPADARSSLAIRLLNLTQLFPVDPGRRAFVTAPHLPATGQSDLTPTEFYLLILAADMGVNYYARENNPHPGP